MAVNIVKVMHIHADVSAGNGTTERMHTEMTRKALYLRW